MHNKNNEQQNNNIDNKSCLAYSFAHLITLETAENQTAFKLHYSIRLSPKEPKREREGTKLCTCVCVGVYI